MEKRIIEIVMANSPALSSEFGEIVPFFENGEMAPVKWFRQGNVEVNGKYVEKIIYGD